MRYRAIVAVKERASQVTEATITVLFDRVLVQVSAEGGNGARAPAS